MFDWPGKRSKEPARGRFKLAEGGELECATWGAAPASEPTLLLLHEGLGCIELWHNFPVELSRATGCGVLAYSRLGYGHSSSITPPLPVTRMADEARAVLPRLIEAIGPTKLVLIGHSDGGTIAAHYLVGETNQALKGAVLMAPHFYCEASNVAAIRATRDAYTNGGLRAKLAKYHDDVDGAFHGWAETWLDPRFSVWDMRDDIRRWHHPVLFIQGRDDPYGSEGQAEAASQGRDVQIAWLDACKHSPHLEKSGRTLELISSFVAKVTGDGS